MSKTQYTPEELEAAIKADTVDPERLSAKDHRLWSRAHQMDDAWGSLTNEEPPTSFGGVRDRLGAFVWQVMELREARDSGKMSQAEWLHKTVKLAEAQAPIWLNGSTPWYTKERLGEHLAAYYAKQYRVSEITGPREGGVTAVFMNLAAAANGTSTAMMQGKVTNEQARLGILAKIELAARLLLGLPLDGE